MNIINGQDYDIKLVPMCLNCQDCQSTPEGFVCVNESNKEAAAKKLREKILALSEGYSLENLSFDLKPVPLRAPEKKCPNQKVDMQKIIDYLTERTSLATE